MEYAVQAGPSEERTNLWRGSPRISSELLVRIGASVVLLAAALAYRFPTHPP